MLGAIIGDIVGSRWEFDPTNDYDFELFSKWNDFTDDTICTIAVADALLKGKPFGPVMHDWCRRYPNPMGGYGCMFSEWVDSDDPVPYRSYGNGAAMRVSPVAWFYRDVVDVLRAAREAACCTHNHEEGIKGAQAVALAMVDCSTLSDTYDRLGKRELEVGLRRAVEWGGYSMDIDIRDVQNQFSSTCQGTVPVALWVVRESKDFEDAIRKAVSLGADADTLGAIVGGIAEVIWGIPQWLKDEAIRYLPAEMVTVLEEFRAKVSCSKGLR